MPLRLPSRATRDRLWLAWFVLQLPVILCVDAVDVYPDVLCSADPASPLHALHRFRAWYVATYNDPLLQWAPPSADGREPEVRVGGAGGSWLALFFAVELAFALPTALYAVYRLGRRAAGRQHGRESTSALELLLLVYAFETAFTTAVCLHDVAYWDPAVFSPAQKNVFRYQLMGPWFAIPTLLFVDMYSRLLARLKVPEGETKKTQ